MGLYDDEIYAEYAVENEKLKKQVETLRAALKQCDEAMAWCLGGEPIDTLMIEARRAAAAALKETGNGH